MAKEDAQHFGNCPDELSVGQAQQEIVAEVLPPKEGTLLGAWSAEEEALAREGTEQVVAAIGTSDARDALVPVSAEAESGGGAADEGEAELAKESGVPLLIGGLEGWEPLKEELARRIRPTGTVESPSARLGRRSGRSCHMEKDAGMGASACLRSFVHSGGVLFVASMFLVGEDFDPGTVSARTRHASVARHQGGVQRFGESDVRRIVCRQRVPQLPNPFEKRLM